MSLFWRFPVSYSVYRLGVYIALHTLDEFVPFGLRLMDWGVNRIIAKTLRQLNKTLRKAIKSLQGEIRA